MPKGITAARTARASWRVTRWFLVALRSGRLPAGLAAVATGIVLSVLVTDAHFVVRRVTVEGVVALAGPGLAETSGVLGRGVFAVDAQVVADRLAQLSPVRRVEVRTEFPDHLVIRVQERQATLVWETGASSFLLDRDGTVLAKVEIPPPSLPRVRVLTAAPIAVGEQVEPRTVHAVLAVIDRLPTEAGVSEAAVMLDPVIGVIVQTERWNAVVGTDEQLGRKLAVLKALVRPNQPWTEIDLRDPTRVALQNTRATPTAVRTADMVSTGRAAVATATPRR